MTSRTLWIAGTSVSIEEGGYVTQLTERAAQLGMPTRNLSVGDQTSIMGCMRVLGVRDEIQPDDIVVWEYSLLDTLLGRSPFVSGDMHAARRVAWQCVLERGARLIVLLVAPKKYLGKRSTCETKIARDAQILGLPCIDTRDLFSRLGIREVGSHYRDDRHPCQDSPVTGAMADAVLAHALAPSRPRTQIAAAWGKKNIMTRWQWEGAESLAANAGLTTRRFSNSLIAIDAIALAPGMAIEVSTASRIIGVGIVSTHDSGGIWCGHAGCPPASTRLPLHLPHSFLLRTTAIPCLRGEVSSISSIARNAHGKGVWADYGQDPNSYPGEVAVFGVLYETQSDARTRLRVRAQRYWRRLRMLVRQLSGG